MTQKCLFAYTQLEAGEYPGYVNLALHPGDKHPLLTVRTRGAGGSQVAALPMPDEQLEDLHKAIGRYLVEKGR